MFQRTGEAFGFFMGYKYALTTEYAPQVQWFADQVAIIANNAASYIFGGVVV